jgi:hypothetical protein
MEFLLEPPSGISLNRSALHSSAGLALGLHLCAGIDDKKASGTFASDVGVANRGRRGGQCTSRLTGSRVLR